MPYDTIPREEEIKATCPFCGKTRTYYYRKGYTWVDYSTARSSYIEPEPDDKGCDCFLGKLKYSKRKIEIKRQCANCSFNKDGYCTSKEEREDVSSMFGISGELWIKDQSKKCRHHKLSREIFDRFVSFIN